ncbi:MAG TPA: NADH-quinone oxidoreductase subunit K [Candidatus Polarisedimenticolaceae bacterium]|nr:NADH-quinone oxidoreductase subunit K [Candidatus Polarisedimenticolaceae bacterium]
MNPGLDTLMVLLIVTNLRVLGSSRLGACIRTVAMQGVLLGLLPLAAHSDELEVRVLLLAATSMGLKAFAFPWLLFRALRGAKVRREIEPYVGYSLSLLVGMAALGLALWIGSRLPLPNRAISPLLVPVALSTMFIGLFLIVSRRKALSQVLGYLVFENGIYAFGVGVAYKAPLLVELGVLLDVFVAVFVMGILIFHISREFDSIDTARLSSLRD